MTDEHGPTGRDTQPGGGSAGAGDAAGVEPVDLTGPRLDQVSPSSSAEPGAHLVLGYRQGELGAAVLRTGADIAGRLDATLHVVHVVDLSDYPIDPDAWDWEQQAERTLAAEKRAVEAALAAQPTPWTYHAAHGNPVALLRQVADEYDALMIVVGTRGEGGGSILSRLTGEPSVSHGLVARTHRPVLVVPPRAASPRPDPSTADAGSSR